MDVKRENTGRPYDNARGFCLTTQPQRMFNPHRTFPRIETERKEYPTKSSRTCLNEQEQKRAELLQYSCTTYCFGRLVADSNSTKLYATDDGER